MRYTRMCPKCDSTDIIIIPGKIGPYGSGNNIPADWMPVLVHRFICGNCGYSEEWVNKSDIPDLRRKYQTK